MNASNNFINECKNRAQANRLGRIIVENLEEPITNSDNLQEITIDDGCYVDGAIIGTTYSKKAKINIIDENLTENLIDKTIYPEIGVKYADNSTEYIKMGKYTIEHPNNEQTANLGEITAYDDFDNLDKPYVCNLDFSNDDITIADFYVDVCNQLGLTPKTTEFINSTLNISGNPFTNNESIRIVLSDIEEVACSFSEIDWETNEIDLVWLSQSTEPDYTFEINDYSTLNGGKIKYGPVNSLVIKDSQIEGENVSIEDDESIEINGEIQLTIEDNYFLYTQQLRDQAIDGIWERIKGLTYIDYELETYYGKPFLKCGSKIGIHTNEDEYFESYVLTHTFKYDGTFYSKISGPSLTKQETNRKNSRETIKDKFRRTEQITDKINGQIIEIVQEQDEQQEQIAQTIMNVNSIQNLFQITGGNNLIKDSQLLLKDEGLWEYGGLGSYNLFPSSNIYPSSSSYPMEYYYNEPDYIGGYDATLIGKTVAIAKIGVSNGKMTTSQANITGLMVDNMYTLSFKISNDNNTTSKVRLIGNGNVVYSEQFDTNLNMKIVQFSFVAKTSSYVLEIQSSSTTNGYVYIYDLMLNKGDVQSWEPAIGEMVSTVLKLSQLGLQVNCTGSEIATLMTAQGFEVRRFQNGTMYEVVTEFTKDGFISKKGILEELELNGFDFRTISYQGYETLVLYKKESGS